MDRKRLNDSRSYRFINLIRKWFDDYYLDPIIGFLPWGIGDTLTGMLVLPFIYVAAFKVRSLSLTLAIIYNTLVDIFYGLLPFFIGDIIDFLHKSYGKNYALIIGFVEGDREIISQVNRKAWRLAAAVFALVVAIYWLVRLIAYVYDYVLSLF